MLPLTHIQAESLLSKSMELAEKDPHGLIITIVSISVVFLSLALLFVLYFLFGRLINIIFKEKKQEVKETHEEESQPQEDKDLHDQESNIITICRKDNLNISSQAPLAIRSGVITIKSTGNTITAPLPGTMTAVLVKPGDRIREGQTVAILEAMKMENEIQAEVGGTVKEVNVSKGDSVLEGTIIVTLR